MWFYNRQGNTSPFPTMVCISPVLGSTLARHRSSGNAVGNVCKSLYYTLPKMSQNDSQGSNEQYWCCTLHSSNFFCGFSAEATWHTFLPRAIEALVSRHLSLREHRSKMLQESGFGHFWTMICHVESPLRQKDRNKMEKIAKDRRSLSVFFSFLSQLGEIKIASGTLCVNGTPHHTVSADFFHGKIRFLMGTKFPTIHRSQDSACLSLAQFRESEITVHHNHQG